MCIQAGSAFVFVFSYWTLKWNTAANLQTVYATVFPAVSLIPSMHLSAVPYPSTTNHKAPHHALSSSSFLLLMPKCLPQHCIFSHCQPLFFLYMTDQVSHTYKTAGKVLFPYICEPLHFHVADGRAVVTGAGWTDQNWTRSLASLVYGGVEVRLRPSLLLGWGSACRVCREPQVWFPFRNWTRSLASLTFTPVLGIGWIVASRWLVASHRYGFPL